MDNIFSEYLSHHGIDGQKWGIKRGPPYPLDKPASYKKATKRAKNISNKELKDIVYRKTLEDKYASLMEKEHNKGAAGKIKSKGELVLDTSLKTVSSTSTKLFLEEMLGSSFLKKVI